MIVKLVKKIIQWKFNFVTFIDVIINILYHLQLPQIKLFVIHFLFK